MPDAILGLGRNQAEKGKQAVGERGAGLGYHWNFVNFTGFTVKKIFSTVSYPGSGSHSALLDDPPTSLSGDSVRGNQKNAMRRWPRRKQRGIPPPDGWNSRMTGAP
jgi:hypothetical protein